MMSAIDLTAKTSFERLYLVRGLRKIAPSVNSHSQPRPFTVQLFLDFRAIFFSELPLIFLVITINQVIWPSPDPLRGPPESRFQDCKVGPLKVTDRGYLYRMRGKQGVQSWVWQKRQLVSVFVGFMSAQPCALRHRRSQSLGNYFSISLSCWWCLLNFFSYLDFQHLSRNREDAVPTWRSRALPRLWDLIIRESYGFKIWGLLTLV